MTHYQYIIFDLDGTLINSEEGITKSVEFALHKMGIDCKREELLYFIGPPLKSSFEDKYNFNEPQVAEAITYFREYFATYGISQHELYDGMTDVLKTLKQQGKTILLGTSKPEEFAKKILDQYDITRYFDYICGASMDEVRSEKADVLAYALELSKITELDNCIMIGDRKHDVLGAKSVGIETIGVTFGFGDREELEKAGAKYIVNTAEEIITLLQGK